MELNGHTIRRTIFDAFIFAYLAIFLIVAYAMPDSDVLVAQMDFNLRVFFGLFLLGALIATFISSRGIKTLGDVVYAPAHKRMASATPVALHRTFWGIELIFAIVVTCILGVILTDVSIRRLVEAESFFQAMRLFGELAHPDWAILPRAIMKMIETIYIAFMSTAISVPIAFVLSFFMSKNVVGNSKAGLLCYTVMRTVFNVIRSIEPVLWAIIFSIWVSFGPFAGMLALMVHSVASLAKQFAEIVESVEDGPIEGIQSTGANKLQTVWFAIVPQIVLPFISFTIFRWDINVRMATILGFVGGGGIGTMLIEYQGQAQWPQVGTIIIVVAFVVWVMDAFSAHVREAIK